MVLAMSIACRFRGPYTLCLLEKQIWKPILGCMVSKLAIIQGMDSWYL